MGFSEEPMSRLTRIGDRLLQGITEEEEETIRVVVLVFEPGNRKTAGALSAAGYPEGQEGQIVNDLLNITQAAAEASGMNMSIFNMPNGGEG